MLFKNIFNSLMLVGNKKSYVLKRTTIFFKYARLYNFLTESTLMKTTRTQNFESIQYLKKTEDLKS